ncbi:MAG: AraC family transcriptional regulator [Acidimicrobiales bacterium]
MADDIPTGAACRVEAWRPPGIDEISEVFHARIVDYGYPLHCHDTWTVLIVDTGAISYDLDRKQCGALRETVAILPPGVTHNGKPAPGAKGFAKRVLYLDESVLPVDLIGAAVDRTNIKDSHLRSSLAALHDDLVVGADPFAASSALAMIAERITQRLKTRPDPVAGAEQGVAEMLRLMLDEPMAARLALDDAARILGRSKAHLIRSFTARYGVAPHAYLIGKRIEAARKLLLEGVQAAEVAAVVGFYDQSHFTRHFKRHTAVSPAAYAASHGASPASGQPLP